MLANIEGLKQCFKTARGDRGGKNSEPAGGHVECSKQIFQELNLPLIYSLTHQ